MSYVIIEAVMSRNLPWLIDFKGRGAFLKQSVKSPGLSVAILEWQPEGMGEFKGSQLNDRQTKAVLRVQQQGYITRSQYETELGVSGRTANRDLRDLVTKGIFSLQGTGPKSRYVLSGDEPKDGDI